MSPGSTPEPDDRTATAEALWLIARTLGITAIWTEPVTSTGDNNPQGRTNA